MVLKPDGASRPKARSRQARNYRFEMARTRHREEALDDVFNLGAREGPSALLYGSAVEVTCCTLPPATHNVKIKALIDEGTLAMTKAG